MESSAEIEKLIQRHSVSIRATLSTARHARSGLRGRTLGEATFNKAEWFVPLIDGSNEVRADRPASDGEGVRMHSPWMGEFMGTMVLVLLGNGVNAGVTLRKSYAADSGWIVVATGWALGVLCGVIVAQGFGSHDAALNPAITLAGAILNGKWGNVLPMWSAQMLGAMCGATLMTLHYAPHWKLSPNPAAKLGIFCTGPAVNQPIANIWSEVLGTAVLVIVAGAIFSPGVAAHGPVPGLGPALVGSLVWGIGLSLGGTTGYAINPARDLGPRLVHALLPIPGKGGSNWSYAAIPVAGPLLGAVLAGLLLRATQPW